MVAIEGRSTPTVSVPTRRMATHWYDDLAA